MTLLLARLRCKIKWYIIVEAAPPGLAKPKKNEEKKGGWGLMTLSVFCDEKGKGIREKCKVGNTTK